MSHIRMPEAMKTEHAELHAALVEATRARIEVRPRARLPGCSTRISCATGRSRSLPPLGLLEDLAHGAVTPEMADELPLTDALERELPGMLREHAAIRTAVEGLRKAARSEGDQQREGMAGKILLHASIEEQVSYPAAVLVGRTIRAALGR